MGGRRCPRKEHQCKHDSDESAMRHALHKITKLCADTQRKSCLRSRFRLTRTRSLLRSDAVCRSYSCVSSSSCEVADSLVESSSNSGNKTVTTPIPIKTANPTPNQKVRHFGVSYVSSSRVTRSASESGEGSFRRGDDVGGGYILRLRFDALLELHRALLQAA